MECIHYRLHWLQRVERMSLLKLLLILYYLPITWSVPNDLLVSGMWNMASVAWLLLIGMLISSTKSNSRLSLTYSVGVTSINFGVQRLFLIVMLNVVSLSGFLALDCLSENHGENGQRTLLKCMVKTTQGEATIKHLVWKKGNTSLLMISDSKLIEKKDGFQLAEPAWNVKNMNVSLLLTNTKMTDEGKYECFVYTDVGFNKVTVSLKVTAKYLTPTMNSIPGENIKENGDVTMFCNTTGGQRTGSIQWFDEHGTNWTRSSEMTVRRTDEGLFELSSKFKVLKASTSTSSAYTCSVHDASGVKKGGARLELQFQSGHNLAEGQGVSATKYVAPIVVIGSLIIGLLITLIICRKRSQQARRLSTAPLMSQNGKHHQVSVDEV